MCFQVYLNDIYLLNLDLNYLCMQIQCLLIIFNIIISSLLGSLVFIQVLFRCYLFTYFRPNGVVYRDLFQLSDILDYLISILLGSFNVVQVYLGVIISIQTLYLLLFSMFIEIYWVSGILDYIIPILVGYIQVLFRCYSICVQRFI